MEDVKQQVSLMMEILSKTDDFDEDLERNLVNQTQKFTKHSETLNDILQKESELPDELLHKIIQHIEFLTNFCDHSQEVIGEGYLTESVQKFKNWLFSQELPFSISDEESETIKKFKTENDRTNSKNDKQPSDHFDFNSFPSQQQQQSQQPNSFQSKYAQGGQDDMFSAFSNSQVKKEEQLGQPTQYQSKSPFQQSNFSSDMNDFQFDNSSAYAAGSKLDGVTNKNQSKMSHIQEVDNENEDADEKHRKLQAELDSQMKEQRYQKQQEDDRIKQQQLENERLKKQREDEERLRRQKEEENERIRRQQQQQEEDERIKKLKEAEDKQKKQKEEEDRLRKQAEDQQKILIRQQQEEDERKRARIQQDAEEAEKMRLQLLREQQEQDRLFEEAEIQRQKAFQLLNQSQGFNNNQPKYQNEDRFSFNDNNYPQQQGNFYTSKGATKQTISPIIEEDERNISYPQSRVANSKLSKIEKAFSEAPQEKFSFGDSLRKDYVDPYQLQNQSAQNDNNSEISFKEQFSVSNSEQGERNNEVQIEQNFSKGIRLLDNQDYQGQEVIQNDTIDGILNSNQYQSDNKRCFKKANLKRKCTIYEDDKFQIGCESNLIFDSINQQSYLKLAIFIGNKTRLSFRNIQVEYDGDETCYVHQKVGKTIDFIPAKTQEKIEIFLGHYIVPYGLVNIIISGELWDIELNEEVNIVAFLPNLLTKYFQFMDLDTFFFKQTWEQMSQYIQKTDIFTISKSIIKTPQHFRGYFANTFELTSLDLFLSQQNYDIKYYELGALIELYDQESNYLLKFNIRPDNTLCIQIIATNQAYRTTAAVLLQHLRFLLQG